MTAQPTIKLYLAPGACSLAPHILLREAGTSFEIERVSARNGLPEDFARINPKKRVPVLVLDDQVITEVPAVMTAIAQMVPERKLVGKNDLEVVRSYEWMNWLSGWLHGVGFGMLWRPQRYSDDEKVLPVIREKGRKTVEEAFEMLEGKLMDTLPYAVGDGFTVVDAYLFVFWRWGCDIGVDMEKRFPRYKALVEKLVEREAVKKALAEEGIEALTGKAKM